MIWLVAQRRQGRRRLRSTPNTTTATTTMISTHNHVDMAASLGGARAVRGDATAAHPSKQLVTAGDLPGPDRRLGCARARGGLLHPAPCPPIWAGRAAASPTPALSSHRCALMSARWHLRRLA